MIRVVCRLCEENSPATLIDVVDMAEKYAALCGTETSILDLPDEVLSQIILLLSARERIPLGESCQRFKTLVFEDQDSLKYLDFSTEGHLTTMTHIQQYFDNENACQRILRIDARDVKYLAPGDSLNNSIGKAINLVEVNIHGVRFKDLQQLGSFLQPLIHLVKLSFDWPETVEPDTGIYEKVLQRPFSKLTYLSVNLERVVFELFTIALSVCQQLEKLFIKARGWDLMDIPRRYRPRDFKPLTNLTIVQYHGRDPSRIKQILANLFPDPERWTDFQLFGHATRPKQFYIEKDVEVCEELLGSERLKKFLNPEPWENFKLGWALSPVGLLNEVLRITHEDVPDDLCCLSTFVRGEPHLLKVEHAKMLLKDPRCQIPSLYLNHRLERGCDAHLLASAFPNLSELVLSTITRNSQSPPKDPHYRRCLRRKCSPVPEGQDDSSVNLDSSFRMLVENTPNLRHFTLNPNELESADWDLDALHLISGWKSLESLHISGILIEDGQFLAEIGKQCKNLQTLSLHHLSSGVVCRYEDALFEMLQHCRTLRNFTIDGYHVNQVKMFELLAKNVNLERVCIENISVTTRAALPPISDWIRSFKNLLRQCENLTRLRCSIISKSRHESEKVESTVRRLTRRRDIRRRNIVFGLSYYTISNW